jgi:hypothetical protein
MKYKGVSNKVRRSVRKLCSDVHVVVFNKAFIIPSTTRWNINMNDKIGRLLTSKFKNYVVIYMVPCLIASHS